MIALKPHKDNNPASFCKTEKTRNFTLERKETHTFYTLNIINHIGDEKKNQLSIIPIALQTLFMRHSQNYRAKQLFP